VEGVDEGGAKEGEAAMERGTRSVRGHHHLHNKAHPCLTNQMIIMFSGCGVDSLTGRKKSTRFFLQTKPVKLQVSHRRSIQEDLHSTKSQKQRAIPTITTNRKSNNNHEVIFATQDRYRHGNPLPCSGGKYMKSLLL